MKKLNKQARLIHNQNAGFKKDTKKLEKTIRDKEAFLNKLTDAIVDVKKYYDAVCRSLHIRDQYKINIADNGVASWVHNYQIVPRQKTSSSGRNPVKSQQFENEFSNILNDKLGRLIEMRNSRENYQIIKQNFQKDFEDLAQLKGDFIDKKALLTKLTEHNAQLRKELTNIESVG